MMHGEPEVPRSRLELVELLGEDPISRHATLGRAVSLHTCGEIRKRSRYWLELRGEIRGSVGQVRALR